MMRIKPFFAWYDCWVGAFFDRKNRNLCLCPLPRCCLRISFK
jgi:hypothetical protein